jgi:hypothetical protein
MREMPVRWAVEDAAPRGRLKSYLLLALTTAVLAFCGTLLVH